MQRVVVFVVAGGITLALLLGANVQVDPLGDSYHPQALALALAHSGCAIGQHAFGNDEVGLPALKLDLVGRMQPRRVVVGVSRVLAMRARPGERAFVNVGIPGLGPPDLALLFALIRQRDPGRLTVYLEVEPFWFNSSWTPFAILQESKRERLRRAFSRLTTQRMIARVVRHPGVVLPWGTRGLRTQHGGPGCIVTSSGDGGWRPGGGYWRVDGSLHWGAQPIVPPSNFVQANQLALANFTSLDTSRLAGFRAALEQARGYGWQIIGFVPPYDKRALHDLQHSYLAPTLREFDRTVPPMLHGLHFAWLDLSSGPALGCGAPDDYIGGDGWHPADRCSARVRLALDRLADRP